MPKLLAKKSLDLLDGYFSKNHSDILLLRDCLLIKNQKYKIDDSDLERIQHIGSSQAKSTVEKFSHKPTGEILAIKIFPIPKKHYERLLKKIANEIRILHQVSGVSNIVTFYGWTLDINHAKIFMECMETSLDQLIKIYYKNQQALNLYELIAPLMDVFHGLVACKDLKISHGDLKPENILVNKYGKLKLADFGESYIHGATLPKAGMPEYWPPEKFAYRVSTKFDLDKFDIWSLGIIMMEGYYGLNPIILLMGLQERLIPELINFMLDPNTINSLNKLNAHMLDYIREFIALCLRPYDRRPNFQEMMSTKVYKHIMNIRKGAQNPVKEFSSIDTSRFLKLEYALANASLDQSIKIVRPNQLKFPDDHEIYETTLHDIKFTKRHFCPKWEQVLVFHKHSRKNISLQVSVSEIEKEIALYLKFQSNPEIVSFYGLMVFSGQECMCLEGMDCCFGRLYYLLNPRKTERTKIIQLPYSVLAHISVVVLKVLCYLNERGYAHGYIQRESILLHKSGSVKITLFHNAWNLNDALRLYEMKEPFEMVCTKMQQCRDLGMNIYVPEEVGCSSIYNEYMKLAETCRNEYYVPPERIFEPISHDFRNDLWALGAMITDTVSGISLRGTINWKSCGYLIKNCGYYSSKKCYTAERDEKHDCLHSAHIKYNEIRSRAYNCFSTSFYPEDFLQFLLSCLRDLNYRPKCIELMKTSFVINCLKNYDSDKEKLSKYMQSIDFVKAEKYFEGRNILDDHSTDVSSESNDMNSLYREEFDDDYEAREDYDDEDGEDYDDDLNKAVQLSKKEVEALRQLEQAEDEELSKAIQISLLEK